MYFKEDDKFVNYLISYKDREEVARITLERLKNLKSVTTGANQMPRNKIRVVSDKNGLHLDVFYYNLDGLLNHVYSIRRDRISSDVPFSIAVGKGAIPLDEMRKLVRDKKAYLSYINGNYSERLSNVLHCETSKENIYKIIKMLENDPEILEEFYREYQKDLIAFKELLPLIELVEASHVSFDEQKSKIDSLIQEKNHIFTRFDLDTNHPKTSHSGYQYAMKKINDIDKEISSWPSQLSLAEENTEVAKKLNLQFKKVR